jgi:hypothetical protein
VRERSDFYVIDNQRRAINVNDQFFLRDVLMMFKGAAQGKILKRGIKYVPSDWFGRLRIGPVPVDHSPSFSLL